MVSQRLPRLAPATLRQDQSALYDAITGGPRAQGPQHFALAAPDGTLNGPFNALLYSPALGTALQEVGAAVRYRTGLPDRARELAILLVAARWDSAFERESHEAVARSLGFSEADLEAVRREDPSSLAEEEAAFARAVLALLDGDMDDEQWDAARSELGLTAIFELTALVGYYSTLALQLRVFRV